MLLLLFCWVKDRIPVLPKAALNRWRKQRCRWWVAMLRYNPTRRKVGFTQTHLTVSTIMAWMQILWVGKFRLSLSCLETEREKGGEEGMSSWSRVIDWSQSNMSGPPVRRTGQQLVVCQSVSGVLDPKSAFQRSPHFNCFLFCFKNLKQGGRWVAGFQVRNLRLDCFECFCSYFVALNFWGKKKKKVCFHTLFVTFDYSFWMQKICFSCEITGKYLRQIWKWMPGKMSPVFFLFCYLFTDAFKKKCSIHMCNIQNPFNPTHQLLSFLSDSIFSNFYTQWKFHLAYTKLGQKNVLLPLQLLLFSS